MGKNTLPLDELTAEQGRSIFDKAIANGDLGPALFYMACALAKEPMNQESLDKIDTLIRNQSDLMDYLELHRDQYYPKVALAGYISYKQGNVDYGMDVLRTIIEKIPQTGYMSWIDEWIRELIYNPKNLKQSTLTAFVASCLEEMNDYHTVIKNDFIEIFIKLYQSLAKSENVESDTLVNQLMTMSLLKKSAGDIEGAIMEALRAFECTADMEQAIFVGQCYREIGWLENAKLYFDKAIELEPNRGEGYVELANLLFDEKDYEEAEALYEKALDIQPNDNEWTEPSLYFCQYVIDKNQEAKEKLMIYKERHPNSQRAIDLLECVAELERKPYEDYIPLSKEVVCDILKEMMKSKPQGIGSMEVNLETLESPSAINALRLYCYDYDTNAQSYVGLEPNAVIPDISPVKETGVVFWKYDETYQQKPVVRKPNSKVVEAVLKLTNTPYSCKGWYELAEELAQSLGHEDIKDLYGIMVHPPRPSYEVSTDGWLMCVQYAAVFLLAHIEDGKRFFNLFSKHKQPSIPRKSIVDICYGQLDWPIIPAIVVLSYQAQILPECRETVKSIFVDLMQRRRDELAYCFFEDALVTNFLKLPNLDEVLARRIMKWHQEK